MKFEKSIFVNDSFTVDNIEICTGQFASNSKLSVHLWYVRSCCMGNDIKRIHSVNIAGCFLQGTSKNLKQTGVFQIKICCANY